MLFRSIYPQLRRMLADGLVKERVINKSQRSRIEYSITAKGERVFADLNETISDSSWDDEGFEARFAFFTATTKRNRLRILEGRLARIQQKMKMLESEPKSTLKNLDKYLAEWRSHALESAEREIAWLEKIIKAERK